MTLEIIFMTDINILGLENLRRKTAMVLHQIEISLGNFILNQNDYLIENAINNQNNNVIRLCRIKEHTLTSMVIAM